MRQTLKTIETQPPAPPGESDSFASKPPSAVEPAEGLARPHPEGDRPHEADDLQPEQKADLAEQPSETNPISSKSGP